MAKRGRPKGTEPKKRVKAKYIPLEFVIDVEVFYIVKRQLQGRPTTLRQVCKRVGLGAPMVKGILEKNRVQYILIAYGEKDWVTSGIEIAIKSLPENIAIRNGYTTQQIEDAYEKYFGDYVLEKVEETVPIDPGTIFKRGGPKEEEDPVLAADPYAYYRIDTPQFQVLKHELIAYSDLIKEAMDRGYSGSAIRRATGGHRLIYELAGPLWKPYMYKNKRYYLREVLNHLNQSYKTYKFPKTGTLKMNNRKKKLGIV